MKKIIMLIVCLTMMGIQSVSAQAAIAALHHEGKVTIYSSAQDAIDNSVAGDTVYLSEGMFGGFTVNKRVAVIGSGIKTTVSPDITIVGNSDIDEQITDLSLCNLSVVNDVLFGAQASPKNVKIRQCKIAGNFILYGSHATDIEILMCYIQGALRLEQTTTDNLSVINTKIGDVEYGGKNDGSVSFVNCNIGHVGSDPSNGRNIFINCIVESAGFGYYNHCLYHGQNGSGFSDCWGHDDNVLDDNLDCSLASNSVKWDECLGTDGSFVGITGGTTPYTLASPYLRITDHSVEVDNDQRKLKVTLTLGTEE